MLTAWTETPEAPSGFNSLTRPFRDAEGRPYVAEPWSLIANGSPVNLTRLHRWTGRRWQHLDVKVFNPLSPTILYYATVTDLATIQGDTLVAASSQGLIKWTGSDWRFVQGQRSSAYTNMSGAVERLAYDAARQRVYFGGGDFKVYFGAGALSMFNDQRSVGYLDLVTRRWKGLGGYSGLSSVTGLALDASGRLVVSGNFTQIGGAGFQGFQGYVPPSPARQVARFTPDDSTWAALGGGPNPAATSGFPMALRLASNGDVVVAGPYDTGGKIHRWDGAAWTGVDAAAPLNGGGSSVELTPGGTYLAGSSAWTTHSAAGSTWRWTGSAWEEYTAPLANFYVVRTSGAYSGTYEMKLTAAMLWFFESAQTCVYGTFQFAIASGPSGSRTGYACRASDAEKWRMQYPTGVIQGDVYALTRMPDGTLYAGGRFAQIGALDAASLAVRVGEDWVPVDGAPASAVALTLTPASSVRVPQTVNALLPDRQGGLYVGGLFSHIGSSTTANASNIARFTPGSGTPSAGTWASIGGGVSGSVGNGPAVYALAFAPDGTLYVGGNFDYGRPTLSSGASALITSSGLIRWTGSAWEAHGAGYTRAILFGPTGTLYVGGGYRNTSAGQRGVMRWVPPQGASSGYWDGMNGGLSSFGLTGTSEVVNALAFGPGGQLCAGGSFYTDPGSYDGGPSGPRATSVACFNGSQWLAPGGAFPDGTPPTVRQMVGDGSRLFVAAGQNLIRNDGTSWYRLHDALPAWILPPTPTALFLGTAGLDAAGYGRSADVSHVFVFAPTVLTDADPLDDAPRGLDVALGPNPARDRATLRLDVPAPGRVRAAVYDLLGREALRLYDADAPAGRLALAVPTADLTPGMYLVRVDVGGRTGTQRLVVAR